MLTKPRVVKPRPFGTWEGLHNSSCKSSKQQIQQQQKEKKERKNQISDPLSGSLSVYMDNQCILLCSIHVFALYVDIEFVLFYSLTFIHVLG